MSNKRRKSSRRKIKPIFFIFCEGQTEEAYSKFLKQLFRIPLQIKTKVTGQGISQRFIRNFKREIQRGNYSKEDKTFLMYDIDSEVFLNRLQRLNDVEILASNPSIEIWFLLHYKEQNASISTENCLRELKSFNPNYEKGRLNLALRRKLESKMRVAVTRARRKRAFSNPSSTIYKLIEQLESVKSQQR